MILLLAACTPTPVGPLTTDPSLPPQTPRPTDTSELPERPQLLSPALAVDLDPDPDHLQVRLVAAPHVWLAGDTPVDGYAYNEQVPGPTLRAKIGDTLTVELVNQLDSATTLHWHGPTVPYAMDGAGWQTTPVAAGESFTYTFTLQEAGTFWYHPHFNTEQQVDLGLYGALIVEAPSDPPVDEELVLVFDSVGEQAAGLNDPSVDPTPTTWLVNSLVNPIWEPASGSTVRVRMINVSNAGYLHLGGRVIATDQGLLSNEQATGLLVPGDRADIEVSVGAAPQPWTTSPYSHAGPGAGEPLPLFDLRPTGGEPAPAPLSWGFSGSLPTPDPQRTDLRYTFTGSAAAGWEINGATWPDILPDEVPLGAEIILEIRNVSSSHHPFHLHGMAFEVLSIDGLTPDVQIIEDTFDIGIQQTVRLRILADNPGDWMSHCHILPHADAGMMTVLSVVEP